MHAFQTRPGFLRTISSGLAAYTLLFAACSRAGNAPEVGDVTRQDPAVSVVVTDVRVADMDRYLTGIGTVQALNTVTIRTQVDGKIVQLMFQDGQEVHKGDVLAQIDPRPYQSALDQALGKRDQDQAQVEFAAKVVERDNALGAMLDQQTRDQHQATVVQLRATAKTDEAAVSNAQVQLEFTKITAPMDGRVGFRLMDEGNIVRASDASGLVVIKQVQPVSVVFTLPEKNLEALNQPAALSPAPPSLPVSAYDRENNQVLGSGTLGAIDNQIDDVSGTIKLKAIFANEPQTLWPGQFVNVKLLVSRQKALPMIPETALQQGPEGMFVYVVTRDSRAVVRPVAVILTDNGQSFIASGLVPGERVVVDGQYLLQPNARIQEKSPANINPAH